MKTVKREDERAYSGQAIDRTPRDWWKRLSFLVATRTLIASLSLVLAACGDGISGGAATSDRSAAPATAGSAAGADPGASPLALKMISTDEDSEVSNDRFIVKYKSGSAEGRSASSVQPMLDRLAGGLPSRPHHSRRMGIGADVIITERKLSAREAKAFMRAIAADPDVEYVEPDRVMSVQMVPNDPEYARQWGLKSNLTPGVTTAGIRAEAAWDNASGSGVVIAMVDNGVTSHSDLNPNLLPGADLYSSSRGTGDGSNPGSTQNCSVWHGTHVAGIMSALTNNGNGIAGIAPASKLVSVRAMGPCGTGLTSDVADSIVWAAGGSVAGVPANAYPAKLINLSVNTAGACQASLQSAIDSAASRGAIVVVSAGNSSVDVANASPANCFNVVNVAATTTLSNGPRWSYSNFGDSVDVAAPGDNIWSTYNSGTGLPGAESYAYLSGTSMAAPMVTGVMALVQSVAPVPLGAAEMRTLLQQTVQPFVGNQPDQPIGPGILDANAAVLAAKSGKIPAAADFECTQSKSTMMLTCVDHSTGRGARIAQWAWQLSSNGGPDMVRTQSVNPYASYEYAGTYMISLKVTDTNGVVSTLKRPFAVTAPAARDITGSVSPVTLNADYGSWDYYSVNVPQGAKSLTFTLTPGRATDVSTLYVRADSPTTLNAVCSSVMANNTPATCTIANPKPGIWYAISVDASQLSNARLQQVVK